MYYYNIPYSPVNNNNVEYKQRINIKIKIYGSRKIKYKK